MAERPTTAGVISKIEETERALDSLINYHKALENYLGKIKGTESAKSWVIKVRKYLEVTKNNYLPKFKNEMLKLHKKAEEERRMLLERAKKLEKI